MPLCIFVCTKPKSSGTRSRASALAGSTPCHSTYPAITRRAAFLPVMLVAHTAWDRPSCLALTQQELLSLLQERMAKYWGKPRTALHHGLFPSTSLQLLPLPSDPSPPLP